MTPSSTSQTEPKPLMEEAVKGKSLVTRFSMMKEKRQKTHERKKLNTAVFLLFYSKSIFLWSLPDLLLGWGTLQNNAWPCVVSCRSTIKELRLSFRLDLDQTDEKKVSKRLKKKKKRIFCRLHYSHRQTLASFACSFYHSAPCMWFNMGIRVFLSTLMNVQQGWMTIKPANHSTLWPEICMSSCEQRSKATTGWVIWI